MFRNLQLFPKPRVNRSVMTALVLALAAMPASAKTITAVMHSDLRVIDPGFTTAYITRDHGYMVYDTLLAEDSSFKIQPQMADWKVSDDKLTYTFTLRDGLKWHDGLPVTAEDCVASLKRWGRNDGMGQKLMDFTASLEATDEKTITLKLKEPYGLVLESIGKPSSLVPFMMPRRMAETPPGQQIKEQIGSGPFKFVAAEFQPGVKAVYVKNADYVPRKEPPSWTSGGKVVKVDRVEWITMPDAQTAVNALQSGDIDFMENPPWDLLPDELPVSALRQSQDTPRGVSGDEPEGRARRAGRQCRLLPDLRGHLCLRHAARIRYRRRDAGAGQRHGGSEKAARRIRL
jgi:peptide/nickel transport system substrate-binding protein